MPILNIEGRKVSVDDNFLKLTPDQQNMTVDEIAASFKDAPKSDLQQPEVADHGLSERKKLSPIEKAINPITSYPATYDRINKEARQQVSHGVDQLTAGNGAWETAKGVGNIAAGTLGYVASPINAAYRSVVGQPIEDVTGVPREIPEFAAQLATPGIGMTSLTKSEPVVTAVAKAAPSITELKAAAKAGYDSPEVSSLVIKPTAISKYSEETQSALNNAGFDENLAPKTFGILSKLEKVPEGATVTGNNIQSVRRMLGNAAGSTDPTERAAASHAIDALDDLLPKVAQADVLSGDATAAAKTLETARGNYSAAKQAEKIDNKTVQAEVRAAAANSGMNVANTVRQRMADVVLKPAERRGLLPEEVQAAQDISEGTRGQNILRAAGNAMGGGGGLGAAVTGGIGALATPGGIGGLIPIAGFAMKALANKMTLAQAGKLSEMIRSRAPLASSFEKFEVSAKAFDANKSAKTISAAVIASRNLSNNLRASGFSISPTDLMKALSSPGTSNAEDQQS
jgi:hypothetical protein